MIAIKEILCFKINCDRIRNIALDIEPEKEGVLPCLYSINL